MRPVHDEALIRSLGALAGLKLDRPDELVEVRELFELVMSHRESLDSLGLDGTRPSYVFCFHHTAREALDK